MRLTIKLSGYNVEYSADESEGSPLEVFFGTVRHFSRNFFWLQEGPLCFYLILTMPKCRPFYFFGAIRLFQNFQFLSESSFSQYISTKKFLNTFSLKIFRHFATSQSLLFFFQVRLLFLATYKGNS